MEIEIAIEQADHASALEALGATRIELCASLSEGGLTPTVGQCKAVVSSTNLPVHAMLRPRSGNFHYSEREKDQIFEDLQALAQCGIQGLVFGALTADGGLDESMTRSFIARAHRYGLETTFHRAIDASNDPSAVANQLSDWGIDRILTSGGAPKAEHGLSTIQALNTQVGSNLELAIGSGVHGAMLQPFLELGIRSFHCTARTWVAPDNDALGFQGSWQLDTQKVNDLVRAVRKFGA